MIPKIILANKKGSKILQDFAPRIAPWCKNYTKFWLLLNLPPDLSVLDVGRHLNLCTRPMPMKNTAQQTAAMMPLTTFV